MDNKRVQERDHILTYPVSLKNQDEYQQALDMRIISDNPKAHTEVISQSDRKSSRKSKSAGRMTQSQVFSPKLMVKLERDFQQSEAEKQRTQVGSRQSERTTFSQKFIRNSQDELVFSRINPIAFQAQQDRRTSHLMDKKYLATNDGQLRKPKPPVTAAQRDVNTDLFKLREENT